MSSARRSLLTATAAGSLLGALWFVPSATASGEHKEQTAADRAESSRNPELAVTSATAPGAGPRLAETGSTDTTPYLAGGLTFLISGVGIFALSKRRVVGI
ncbi:LPXTG cell wall anchor domain-containing protein [Streptomyces sp. TRM66268-LWL]|uniref:LPXTG cell wall anchor domain-containing protein n=1 Tax=Streptomyces polyasparticus TaxID=2767826 RepID=A0ABR7STX1_9ACTN|nr:LAETG motif-containing sortase-dependent surface protein [Streptomyces polyasparticus]MBC9717728.1 LPXTG cell wall anchor domain-containing protein [Streptomyces polyasparticus]